VSSSEQKASSDLSQPSILTLSILEIVINLDDFCKKNNKDDKKWKQSALQGGDFEGMKWHQEFTNTIETRFFLLDRI
jgi:hypothetical protein